MADLTNARNATGDCLFAEVYGAADMFSFH